MTDVTEDLKLLAGNLWWTWHGELDHLFRQVDVDLWRTVNHNPTAFLADVDPTRIERCALDPRYRLHVDRAVRRLRSYLENQRHWCVHHASGLDAAPVAYFSPEFALHESLPIYSGGLGVLAGDHLKSSSDLGVPMWGVTLLYREGFFRQLIDADGAQTEAYEPIDVRRISIEQAKDDRGAPVVVRVEVDHEELDVQVWHARVGRSHLVLLDIPSAPELAQRLYAGDATTRLRQELVLGVGGYRALKAMGVRPGVLHLNEGHSAFALLEAVAATMSDEGVPLEEATQRVRSRSVFTTHTPVEAGHDRFTRDLVAKHLEPLRKRLDVSIDVLMNLGRVRQGDPSETFCMTVLALKLSGHANAVSALHGRTTRAMWHGLWPNRAVENVPIGHVTNGVHVPSWIATEMVELFRERLASDWADRLCHGDFWQRIHDVDPAELWEVKSGIRRRTLDFVDRRARDRAVRLGLPAPRPLDAVSLTIGYARRFVEYKRALLLFRDVERLSRLLCSEERPVQLVLAGKAHPNDGVGKGILRELQARASDPRLDGRVVVLEDYDLNVGRHLVQGCDVWLNVPRRPLEACGTSGQKAVFNGTLNVSTLDGWWAEAYDGRNGFAIGGGLTHVNPAVHDQRDVESLFSELEDRIVPEYFNRRADGIPIRWIARMQNAIATLAPRFNSDRMVMDYVRGCYAPAAGLVSAAFPPAP